MNWENVKIFLALVREGSVRAAGAKLEISHATVARRIGAFETKLGVKLFVRLPNGLAMTVAGEELLQSALKIEEEMVAIERGISGQDTRLRGMVRVTMPDVIATHLIMPDLVEFVRQYPDIDLQIMPSYEFFDETSLVRIPPGTAEPAYDVWLLTHPDLKDTARLRTFRQFISKAVEKYRDLLEGNCPI